MLINKLYVYNLLYKHKLGVKIYQYFECDGYFYILMDRINGVTLKNANIPESNKNIIKTHITNMLSKLNIVSNFTSNVHNENIMIDQHYKAYIIDW